MSLALLVLAAVTYAVGGLFMKTSDGVTKAPATIAFLALFVGAALMQARGMRDTQLSTGYILVLGLEAVAAVLLGTLYLHDTLTPSRLAAILLIVAGVAWLRMS